MRELIFTGLIAGCIMLLLLSYYSLKNQRRNLFLALSLFCIWISLLITYLNVTGNIVHYIFLARIGNFFAYLIFPFLFFYINSTFYPGGKFGFKRLILLLPAIVYFIDFLPFFLLSQSEKLEVFKVNLADENKMRAMNEGWIMPSGFHFIFKYIFSCTIFAYIAHAIFRNRNNEGHGISKPNRAIYSFLIVLAFLYFLLLFPGLVGALFQVPFISNTFLLWNLFIILIASAFYLLFTPRILYGFAWHPTDEQLKALHQPQAEMSGVTVHAGNDVPHSFFIPPATNALAEKQSVINSLNPDTNELNVSLFETLTEAMDARLLFLNQRFSIHDLSLETNIPVYLLSQVINQQTGVNFSHWINIYRVNYFIQLAIQKSNEHLTIEGLALQSGFSSRITFINAFKKIKGKTPGHFIKTLEKQPVD